MIHCVRTPHILPAEEHLQESRGKGWGRELPVTGSLQPNCSLSIMPVLVLLDSHQELVNRSAFKLWLSVSFHRGLNWEGRESYLQVTLLSNLTFCWCFFIPERAITHTLFFNQKVTWLSTFFAVTAQANTITNQYLDGHFLIPLQAHLKSSFVIHLFVRLCCLSLQILLVLWVLIPRQRLLSV